MHNQTASTVSLAKSVLMALDSKAEQSVLPTRTLELLLNTLIDLGTRDNPTARSIQATQSSFVSARITGIEGR